MCIWKTCNSQCQKYHFILGFSKGKLFVTFSEPMKFKVMPTGMTTGLGQTTTFNCIVQGGRDPALHWDVNGEVVMKQRTVNNMYVNTKNQLVISKIEPTNEGTIKCVAEDIQQKKIISTGVKLEVLRSKSFYK